jgi:hypothetical protein
MANGTEVLVDRQVYIEELHKLRSDPNLLKVEKISKDTKDTKEDTKGTKETKGKK